jgi:hypothetical protein
MTDMQNPKQKVQAIANWKKRSVLGVGIMDLTAWILSGGITCDSDRFI